MANNNLKDLIKGQQPSQSSNSEDKMTGIYELIPRNAKKLRVGRDYQAVIPKLMLLPKNLDKIKGKSITVWLPSKNISDVELNDFILTSKEQYGFNTEQALGFLYCYGHNLVKAYLDLSHFLPIQNWTILDTFKFESAFDEFGKDFLSIRKMLPHKKTKTIVCYYYLWKKRRIDGQRVVFHETYQSETVFQEDSQYSSPEYTSPESDDEVSLDESPALHLNVNCGALQSTASGSICQAESILLEMCDEIQSNIGHTHKKLKLDDTDFGNTEPTTRNITQHWDNSGANHGTMKKVFTNLSTKYSKNVKKS